MSTMSTKITEKMVIDAANGSIVLNGLDFTKNGYVEIHNADSVVIKNCRVYGLNCEDAAKNYWMKVIGDIPVKLSIVRSFFGANPGKNGKLYNLLELNAKLKGDSMISSNWFTADCCTHTMINIYGADEGAVIYVNNNHFADMLKQMRIGIKEGPKCKIISNGNECIVKDTDPESLEWTNLALIQPYGNKTTTFENLEISMKDNKLSTDVPYPLIAYFGGNDTPMGVTSSPKATLNGKDYKISIQTGTSKVAVVGTTAYDSLAEAIAAANGEVITLVNSTEEEIDLSTVEATIVAGRKGLTVHGVEVEF